jgi:hypothetical protein
VGCAGDLKRSPPAINSSVPASAEPPLSACRRRQPPRHPHMGWVVSRAVKRARPYPACAGEVIHTEEDPVCCCCWCGRHVGNALALSTCLPPCRRAERGGRAARLTGSESQARSRHAAGDGRITSHPVGAQAPAP